MALQQAAPTIWRIAREILGGLFLYDFFFWATHFPLHKFPFLYKRFHARHHSNPDVRASDVIKLTFVEEIIDVVCSIAALRVMRAHPLSRTLYNFIITGLLTELHSGYNFPFTLENIIPGGLWAGSKRHHEHHRTGKLYFQKFFAYLDNGTEAVERWLTRKNSHHAL
jgi:cholesterol 25-hydroxylase